MSQTLHIFISDDNTGETTIGLIQPLDGSDDAKAILSEAYLISRLLDDSRTVKQIEAEWVKPKPKFIWDGK